MGVPVDNSLRCTLSVSLHHTVKHSAQYVVMCLFQIQCNQNLPFLYIIESVLRKYNYYNFRKYFYLFMSCLYMQQRRITSSTSSSSTNSSSTSSTSSGSSHSVCGTHKIYDFTCEINPLHTVEIETDATELKGFDDSAYVCYVMYVYGYTWVWGEQYDAFPAMLLWHQYH